jgi:hypoxanthine phosphoribosyltransferase
MLGMEDDIKLELEMDDDMTTDEEHDITVDMPQEEVAKVLVSYNEFSNMMGELVEILKEEKFSAVHGLPRGGLSLAVHLSHFLEIPMIINVTRFNEEYPDGTLLVTDDIIDSGRTFRRFLEIAHLKNIKFKTAVLYFKPHAEYYPDWFLRETVDWICFPWEKVEEIPNREKYIHLGGNVESYNMDLSLND